MHKSAEVTLDEKVRIIAAVQEGKESLRSAGEKIGVSGETIRRWIQNYQSMGVEGITATSRNKEYSPSLKLSAVKEYLSGQGSLSDCQRQSEKAEKRRLKFAGFQR